MMLHSGFWRAGQDPFEWCVVDALWPTWASASFATGAMGVVRSADDGRALEDYS